MCRRRAASLIALLAVVTTAPGGHTAPTNRGEKQLTRVAPAPETPAGLRCLWHAYPDHICRVTANTLVWCDGAEMVYDTGRKHGSHDDLLNTADLEDMMAMAYPVGAAAPSPPPRDVEPGRVRHEPFFRKMYGDSRRAVTDKTRTIRWLDGQRVRVTTTNGVDARLEAVSEALRTLPTRDRERVHKTAGTFNWRRISGTKRQSMHSFAVAIDVGVDHADYWKWSKRRHPNGERVYRNRIPLSVVAAFEAQGFIWGGKWYHFDTMHFEYRPELLHPLCAR